MSKTVYAKANAFTAPAKKSGTPSKLVKPSDELATIVGHHPLPRIEVVSQLWAYIRKHDLQDPFDKRTILVDDKLRAVFGKGRCTIFELGSLISPHLTTA